MTLFSILAFAAVILFLAITPGTRIFTTISRALGSGFNNASFVVMGMVFADLVFLSLAIFALISIASFLGEMFILIKYAAGLYLAYFAYNILSSKENQTNIHPEQELSKQRNFLTGLFTTFSNPKILLFYLGFLPTFTNIPALTVVEIINICIIAAAVLGGVMLFYAYRASGETNLFNKTKEVKKTVKRVKTVEDTAVETSVGSVVIRA